jgi:hypothetical protein
MTRRSDSEGLQGPATAFPRTTLRRGGEPLGLPAPQNEVERIGTSWLVSPRSTLFRRPSNMAAGVPAEVTITEATGILNDDCTDAPAVVASPATEPDENAAPRVRQFKLVERTVGAVPPAAHTEVVMPPDAPAVEIRQPFELPRGERLTQNGHYLIFQEDGNLCVYREADNGWVWCINNDPSIRYAETVRVRTTQVGQLIGEDAAGVVLYALPGQTPLPLSTCVSAPKAHWRSTVWMVRSGAALTEPLRQRLKGAAGQQWPKPRSEQNRVDAPFHPITSLSPLADVKLGIGQRRYVCLPGAAMAIGDD